MINQEQIENATVWELQNQLEFFQRDIDHAEEWLKKVKHAKSIIKAALCLKINGDHIFKDGICGCGAVRSELQKTG